MEPYGKHLKNMEMQKIGQSTAKKLDFSPLCQTASLGSAVVFSEDI